MTKKDDKDDLEKGDPVPQHPAPQHPAAKKAGPEHDPDFQEYPKWVNGVVVPDKATEDAVKKGTAKIPDFPQAASPTHRPDVPPHTAPTHSTTHSTATTHSTSSPWASDKDKDEK